MSHPSLYPVPKSAQTRAKVDHTQYLSLYDQSITDSEGFWAQQGKRLDWFKPYTQIKDVSYAKDDHRIRWYADGELNVAYNCIDRHLKEHGDDVAIIFEGDEPSVSESITYRQLHQKVSRFANVLKSLGAKKGDRVTLYMPMIPEAAYAMLACARIGAIHSVVFGGFSPEALAGRIQDCQSQIIITADEGRRGGKRIALKANVDAALALPGAKCVQHVLMVENNGTDVGFEPDRDVWYHQACEGVNVDCPCEPMNAEDPLFILYTSGSTGKPKGVLHTTGGYLVYASMTHEYVFDYQRGDIYWCTADVGWVTGHSYIVYGPLANGATTVMFEGVPSYPNARRFADVVDKHQVNVLYTAPTAIRALMATNGEATNGADLSSLRLLGSVGEPINPEAWVWYHKAFGREQCPIVDTWWQTETGGILIAPLPGATALKPGSATRPFFGIRPALVDSLGRELEGAVEGNLVMLDSWPGQMRSIYGDHARFIETYFSTYPNCYFTGDGARRDADGYYWITGRVDDVLNVSGHRLGTAEIESALVAHPSISEAAVVGYPHDIKGQGIYVYVSPMAGVVPSDALSDELKQWLRQEIGPIATPDIIQWAEGLPKTRSGKIMRRILRKIAANDHDTLGDISTLADPAVVDDLIESRSFL